jgi:hypothetical protein
MRTITPASLYNVPTGAASPVKERMNMKKKGEEKKKMCVA